MPHEVELIATIAIGFALAFAFGFIAIRLGLPPLVGYLIAGVCIGPSTPGFVADREIAGQLAEIGVILLMFGVGLHFSTADLMAVRRIAIPGAIGQIIIATAIGVGMTTLWGWSFGGVWSSGCLFRLRAPWSCSGHLRSATLSRALAVALPLAGSSLKTSRWWPHWCSCPPLQKRSADTRLIQLTPRLDTG